MKLFIVKQSVQGRIGAALGGMRRCAAAGCIALAGGLVPAAVRAQAGAPPEAARATEPRLRLSADLGSQAPSAGDEERKLLRVEWKATQSRDGEADALERLRRLEATAAQVRAALERGSGGVAPLPAGAPSSNAAEAPSPPAGATAAPPSAGPPPAAAQAKETGGGWLLAAAGAVLAAGAAALALLRRRRAPPPPAQALDTALTVLADPPPAALRRRRRRPA